MSLRLVSEHPILWLVLPEELEVVTKLLWWQQPSKDDLRCCWVSWPQRWCPQWCLRASWGSSALGLWWNSTTVELLMGGDDGPGDDNPAGVQVVDVVHNLMLRWMEWFRLHSLYWGWFTKGHSNKLIERRPELLLTSVFFFFFLLLPILKLVEILLLLLLLHQLVE